MSVSLGAWLKEAEARLRAAGIEEARLDAQVLAAHATGECRSWVLAHPDARVPPGAEAFLRRRLGREPLAYITGEREFYGRSFLVTPDVLIPRPETETLVDVALERYGGQVLDVGTGSGCLAITLKRERPSWFVAGCDVSAAALRLARSNAVRHDAVVLFRRSDLASAFAGMRFGLIVSNPPYVAEGADLAPEVAEHEPRVALYAGPTGLEVFRRLAATAGANLQPWGRLALEFGDGQGDAVVEIFEGQGWRTDQVRPDLAGRPRVAVFRLPPP